MEVRVEIEFDPFTNEGEKRDRIIRAIDRELGSQTVWEKNGDGWIVNA